MRAFSFFTALGIFLCITVASTALAKDSNLPDWVGTPPNDNAGAIYGIGAGPDLDSAKKQALADVAGKLSTQISSERRLYQKMVNGKVDEDGFPEWKLVGLPVESRDDRNWLQITQPD